MEGFSPASWWATAEPGPVPSLVMQLFGRLTLFNSSQRPTEARSTNNATSISCRGKSSLVGKHPVRLSTCRDSYGTVSNDYETVRCGPFVPSSHTWQDTAAVSGLETSVSGSLAERKFVSIAIGLSEDFLPRRGWYAPTPRMLPLAWQWRRSTRLLQDFIVVLVPIHTGKCIDHARWNQVLGVCWLTNGRFAALQIGIALSFGTKHVAGRLWPDK